MCVRLFVCFAMVWMLSLGCVTPAMAQQSDLLERSFSGVSKQTTPQEAKADIQSQASQKISEEVIRELIGDERFSKNKVLIQSKVIKNSARYIPFSKPSELIQEGTDFKMSIVLKVSLRDLKQMLQESSLLNENETIPVVLPVVSFIDRVQGRSYRWWQPAEKAQIGFLFKEGRSVEDALRNSFQIKNFYVIKPIEAGLGLNIPSHFQNERVTGEDAQYFAQYFNAPVLIDGQVIVNKEEKGGNYNIEIRMTAIQVSNSRPIADVSRKFTTDPGPFETSVDKKMREVLEGTANDLASQVFEAWQRGSLGTSVIKVTVQGVSQGLPFMESMKEKIRSQVTQVKNIRERVVSSNSISFEVDASVTASELAQRIEALDFSGKKLSKVSEDRDQVVLKFAQ